MSIITLLTDFGLEDAWVGIMKGVILGINSEARIVDITHQIPPQDTAAAAWTIAAAYPYFSGGSVHVVVVDPGVGGDRDILCVSLGGHIFLVPDNGVLSAVLKSNNSADDIRVVTNRKFFLGSVSNTFHGRDIFAPVGAHLSMSPDISAVGPAVEFENLVRMDLPQPRLTSSGELLGAVIMIDRFGNIITNIDRNIYRAFCDANTGCRPVIGVGTHRIKGLCEAYTQVDQGQTLAVFGSMGYLEIAVNCRNAGRELGITRGDRVQVSGH